MTSQSDKKYTNNSKPRFPISILMADDDQDDREMTQEAFEKNFLLNSLSFVEDGEELLEYLQYRGKYKDANHQLPDIILLDLNMPRKDGREALQEIKADHKLAHIPVIILTTSSAQEDIVRTYNLGGNSFISKPISFQGLIEVTKGIGKYWFEIVKMPA